MDLTTKTFQVLPHSAHADDWVDVLFNIQNNKDTLIEGVKVKFYLSRNSWISTGDYEIGSYDIHSIAGGVPSGMLKTSLHLPPAHDKFWLDDKNATYFIGALIENNNAIDLGSSSAYLEFVSMTISMIEKTKINIGFNIPIGVLSEATNGKMISFYWDV